MLHKENIIVHSKWTLMPCLVRRKASWTDCWVSDKIISSLILPRLFIAVFNLKSRYVPQMTVTSIPGPCMIIQMVCRALHICRNLKLPCKRKIRLRIFKIWMKRGKQLYSPAAVGIWDQIYPVCWRLWSSARDDFDPVCLAKWNQYVNVRHPATSDVLPLKWHHSKWLEFPQCPSHKRDQGGYFKSVLLLAMLMLKQWTANRLFLSMRA